MRYVIDLPEKITNCYDCPIGYTEMRCVVNGKSFYAHDNEERDLDVEVMKDCPLKQEITPITLIDRVLDLERILVLNEEPATLHLISAYMDVIDDLDLLQLYFSRKEQN